MQVKKLSEHFKINALLLTTRNMCVCLSVCVQLSCLHHVTCVCVCLSVCVHLYVEVGGHLWGFSLPFPTGESQGSSSDHAQQRTFAHGVIVPASILFSVSSAWFFLGIGPMLGSSPCKDWGLSQHHMLIDLLKTRNGNPAVFL